MTPSAALRSWTLLRELRRLSGERVLEIGCGAGELALRLIERGLEVHAVEPSDAARSAAAARFEAAGAATVPVADLDRVVGSFDLIVACEVLEHVEDDAGAIGAWAERLRPGGALVITVPAHPERFGPSDVWAGHHRRYRREDLERLARGAGLAVRRLLCFGFPLGRVIEPIRHRVHARRLRREGPSPRRERTARSGIDRGFEGRLAAPWWILPFCWVQVPFFATDHGTGYLLVASR